MSVLLLTGFMDSMMNVNVGSMLDFGRRSQIVLIVSLWLL